MKKKLSAVFLALAASMPMTAQNLVKGNYGYLYCHMSDRGGQPTLFPVYGTSDLLRHSPNSPLLSYSSTGAMLPSMPISIF